MQSLSEEEKRQVLGQVLADQLSAIQEAVKDVPQIQNKLEKMDSNLEQLNADLRTVKTAISDLSSQIRIHEQQIAHLETV